MTIEAINDHVPPVFLVDGVLIEHPNLDGGRATVSALIDMAIAPPAKDAVAFEAWCRAEVTAAIRTKDDGIAARPSFWPDGTEHTVYRVWHLRPGGVAAEHVSVWARPAIDAVTS